MRIRLSLVFAALVANSAPAAERTIDFAKDVKPIFAARCISCHGPDKQKNSYRLDVKAIALKAGESGEAAIVPGKSAESPLIRLVEGRDADMIMPPSGAKLTPEQVAVLKTWIDQGATWPDDATAVEDRMKHWAFQPLPASKPGSIDAFLQTKLSENGLAMSPEADRRTLIRRLYLVLHGLPPTPEEVAAFAADRDPQSYEKLVDRLLASPRYGEKWARHWLDVIAFGETHGFEVNTPRENAWPYRDYVIRSLNDDTPYPRFILEQLAGDTLDTDAATGFLVASAALLPGQVGKDEESKLKARQDELHDMVSTVGGAFLGLTLNCARCHDHKFDPVTQTDYYTMQAMLSGVKHGERTTNVKQKVYAGKFEEPGPTFRLYRGEAMQKREQVKPAAVAAFGSRLQLPAEAPEQERRVALAKWLGDPKNPLPARVLVNRLWMHHFGEGIVSTPSDFGRNGAKPTHPELLDWLAAEFIRGGWSTKHIHKLIVTSAAWKQSSTPSAAGLAKDAGSRLLWRYPPRRLDAEPIRDGILAVSGKLDLTMGGPGFSVFAPNTNYVRVYDPKPEFGPAEWRRAIYMTKVRMAQDATFGSFDCPDAGQSSPKRSRSTTPLQALNLFNSRFVEQQAEFSAERLKSEAKGVKKQVRRGFELALQREPTREEAKACETLAKDHGLAAMCRVLFNTNEFLFVP